MPSVKMLINWQGKFNFSAKNENGLNVHFDAPSDFGGDGAALTPMENVLASLVVCSGIHIIDFLNKRRHKLNDFSINAFADRREEPPRGFTEIKIEYMFKGEELDENDVKEAIKISEEKYWSVGSMLKETTKIKSAYLINRE